MENIGQDAKDIRACGNGATITQQPPQPQQEKHEQRPQERPQNNFRSDDRGRNRGGYRGGYRRDDRRDYRRDDSRPQQERPLDIDGEIKRMLGKSTLEESVRLEVLCVYNLSMKIDELTKVMKKMAENSN